MGTAFQSSGKAIKLLRDLSEKAQGEEWFVQHAATDSGLSRIDDGCEHGMFPIYGEAHEIEFAAACVNYVRSFVVPLTASEQDEKAWRDSGKKERLGRTEQACAPRSEEH